ncbi:Holin family protein [compost metagenome]
MYDKLLNLAVGIVGAIVSYAFGGWSEALALLVILTVLDWLTGLAAAVYEGCNHPEQAHTGLSSSKGFFGILKKVLMFTVIAVLYRVDSLLGLNGSLSLAAGATYFYLMNEFISLLENYGRLNLPLPEQVRRAVSILKERSRMYSKHE